MVTSPIVRCCPPSRAEDTSKLSPFMLITLTHALFLTLPVYHAPFFRLRPPVRRSAPCPVRRSAPCPVRLSAPSSPVRRSAPSPGSTVRSLPCSALRSLLPIRLSAPFDFLFPSTCIPTRPSTVPLRPLVHFPSIPPFFLSSVDNSLIPDPTPTPLLTPAATHAPPPVRHQLLRLRRPPSTTDYRLYGQPHPHPSDTYVTSPPHRS